MSGPRSIYVISMRSTSFFIFIFVMINHIISLKQKRLFFCTFFEYALLFLYNNIDEGYQEKFPPHLPEKIP